MKRTLTALTGALAVLALCTSCTPGPGNGTGSGSKDPIRVGAISSLSGPSSFPEATQAAQAVFDRFNQAGGLNGRTIEYSVQDDKSDPGAAASAARELVGQNEVVAMVGSSSLLECQINSAYYTQEGISAIEGVAVDPVCFDSPAIAPTVVGPYGDTELSLTLGSEQLGLQRICALIESVGSTAPAYEQAIARWSEQTGKRLVFSDTTLPYGLDDYTPYVVKAKAKNCDGVLLGLIEPDALGFLKAAQTQGWDDTTFLSLTTVYTENFAAAAGGFVGKGLHVPAEFAPFTDPKDPATRDWRELMTANKIPLTSFGQAGYLAATNFIEVLKSLSGDVTRESVTAALKRMQPIENPIIGSPWKFGNTPNRSGWPVALTPGATSWESTGDDWIRLPD